MLRLHGERASRPGGARRAQPARGRRAGAPVRRTLHRLGAQGTVCGGGRYDGLFEQLGGKPTPAVGWGMGIERMLLLLEAVGVAMPAANVDAYAIVPDDDALPVAMTTW